MAQHISNRRLVSELQNIVKNDPDSIRGAVAQEALDHDNAKLFFTDLSHHGCVSGMIGSLIYYHDTHKFYDNYYAEIEEIRKEYQDSIGEPIKISGDLKNFLAWFAFEETAYQLTNDLELEI